jgi:drug/metabolite transporter (DMT)-like permease
MKLEKAHYIALLAGTIWGTSGLFTRYLFAEGVSPTEVAVYRSTATALVLGLIILFRDRRLFRVRKQDILFLALFGFFGTSLSFTFYLSAMKYTNLATAAMLMYTNPIYTTILAAVLYKERIYRGKVIGLIMLIGGCILLVKLYDPGYFAVNLAGIAYGLAAGASVSLAALSAKKIPLECDSLTSAFYTFSFGAGFLLLATRPLGVGIIDISARTLIPLALLVFLPGITGYMLYIYSVRRIEVSQNEACVMIEPIIMSIVGYLFFDEMLDWLQIAGALAILIGVFVYNDAWTFVFGKGAGGKKETIDD